MEHQQLTNRKLLILNKISLTSTDKKTAIFLAVENKYYDILQLLLNSKSEININ